ncbi:hypothetical protein [Mesorhizobium sp. CN2-181]|uniref:hypothetical protein n=1 Tax=Mesorhizobium yinganensis TaxID=3157707 RepID=UPI0032B7BCC9
MTWFVLAMAMFKFRLRSPARDHQTDEARFGRLQNFLDQMIAEIDLERKGLGARYESATADAAFLLESQDSEASTEANRRRVDELTAIVRGVERRMKELTRQKDLLKQLNDAGREFQKTTAAPPMTAQPQAVGSGA